MPDDRESNATIVNRCWRLRPAFDRIGRDLVNSGGGAGPGQGRSLADLRACGQSIADPYWPYPNRLMGRRRPGAAIWEARQEPKMAARLGAVSWLPTNVLWGFRTPKPCCSHLHISIRQGRPHRRPN